MEKIFVKDLREKDEVKSPFLLSRKTLLSSKAGKPFLAMMLRDKTGEIDARVWDDAEVIDAQVERGDLVQVEGSVIQFQGRLQFTVTRIEKLSADAVSMADFTVPPKPAPGDRAIAQISEIVDRLQDPNLKALARAFLDDEQIAQCLRRAPAARSVHHSQAGGLAEHTLSVMRLALKAADHYPMVDRDLLVAGAFLHDIGKLREMSLDKQTEYTDEGRLLGHLVIGAEMVHDRCARIEGFPPMLETHLLHIVLSHHGSYEFGSPRLPQTLEALLVHQLDDLDSRMGSWMEILQRDPNERWTDFQKLHNRHFFKGPTPTIHARQPVERKKKRNPQQQPKAEKTDKAELSDRSQPLTDSKAALETHPPAEPVKEPPKAEGSGRPEARRDNRDHRERREKPAAKLSFKPFEALMSAFEGDKVQSTVEAAKCAMEAVAETVETMVESAVQSLQSDTPSSAAAEESAPRAPAAEAALASEPSEATPEKADDAPAEERSTPTEG